MALILDFQVSDIALLVLTLKFIGHWEKYIQENMNMFALFYRFVKLQLSDKQLYPFSIQLLCVAIGYS